MGMITENMENVWHHISYTAKVAYMLPDLWRNGDMFSTNQHPKSKTNSKYMHGDEIS